MEPLLRCIEQETAFTTGRGLLQAVDGVSFDLHRGQDAGRGGRERIGQVRALAVDHAAAARLPPGSGKRSQVLLKRQDLTKMTGEGSSRACAGPEVAIIFQDPMTSLNPVLTHGRGRSARA